MKRTSGVLMHITSLPGDYSTGDFGKGAFDFVDSLVEGGFTYWQVLPFCMPDVHGSPYSSYSAFSLNPFMISLDTLYNDGWLTKEELEKEKQASPWLCDFERLNETRLEVLQTAAERALADEKVKEAVCSFMNENVELKNFCLFMALREANGNRHWIEWENENDYSEKRYLGWQFIQYEFCRQWKKVKDYANKKGIKIIGDIPIYVAYNSSDVWANRDKGIFDIDSKGHLKSVAGVPPDFFSEDGQLWGNPLYNWKTMKKDGYAWWSARLRHLFNQFDGVRIDHFRGLESYWSVPVTAKSAKEGKWIKGPGKAFINTIKEIANEYKDDEGNGRLVIAEDLGVITEEVANLVKYSGFAGIRVLQFGFMGDSNSPHLPHNYCNNCIAYTGTHDNNTLLGFIFESDENTRRALLEYCGYNGGDWERGYDSILQAMLASHSGLVVLPIQDVLRYGADTRFNTPGTADGNWRYRVTKEQLDGIDYNKLLHWNRIYARV